MELCLLSSLCFKASGSHELQSSCWKLSCSSRKIKREWCRTYCQPPEGALHTSWKAPAWSSRKPAGACCSLRTGPPQASFQQAQPFSGMWNNRESPGSGRKRETFSSYCSHTRCMHLCTCANPSEPHLSVGKSHICLAYSKL